MGHGVPSFCRHNRLIQNCPICSREQAVELRPVVSSATPKVSAPRPAGNAGRGGQAARAGNGNRGASGTRLAGRGGSLKVRRLVRGAEDGYHSQLVPGLKSSTDADRLAREIAFAQLRLELLELDPPGPLAEVDGDGDGDVEERTWLAFLVAYLCPLEDAEDPFASIDAVRTSWASGELPDLSDVRVGPRSPYEPERGTATLEAYRAWAARAGTQTAAFTGEASWTPERRFGRLFERLALPGLTRDARYELLVLLGRTGVYELRGATLQLVGENEATVAAKRALGIGDPLLLDRRAIDLADACGVALESLDLALHNWGTGRRLHLGVPAGSEPDEESVERVLAAFGL
jgi:hypothetical protein